uniref:Uncharacterized protein n=1 Tax=Oncorhynchus mykiss TaxID=8022 RepID=A0A8C7SK17_ONCMY
LRGLVFALTCTVNCGTLYRQVCAFPNHVQSIECTVCSFAPDLTAFLTNLFVFKHYEKVVVQLTNGIAVCGQPQQLLQQTLPPPVFQMLLTMLPTIKYLSPILLLMFLTVISIHSSLKMLTNTHSLILAIYA